jgi:hypothetical protein
MKTFMSRAALAGLLMGVSVLASAATPAPEGAEVSIVSPADGATVPQTFTVKFAVEDMRWRQQAIPPRTRATITC